MRTVIVVESPAKGRKIQSYFNDDTLVTSSYGHIYDLSKKCLSIDVDNNFKPNYQPIDGKQKVIQTLSSYRKHNILLAADDDREGDAIAWHCGKVMKINFNDNNRIIFHEISKKAIQNAIQNAHQINMNSVNAQQARRIIDRLVGFSLSPLLWKHIESDKKGLSAGRVQSTLLKILQENQTKINDFKPTYSYEYEGEFSGKYNLKGILQNIDTKNPKNPIDILEKYRIHPNLFVHKIIDSNEIKKPPKPFITSSLQQSAQKELGFSVKKTMTIAQKLYENGKITYMRTDSTHISNDYQRYIGEHIHTKYDTPNNSYYNPTYKGKKIKGAQEAHECIRTTKVDDNLNDKYSHDDHKLYRLIQKRTIISQMASAEYSVITIHLLNNETESIGYFKCIHKVLTFDGYLRYTRDKVSKDDFQAKTQLTLEMNDRYQMNTCICDNKCSPKPLHFNEASLVKKLEKTGIGRPSTYASIIDTLYNRGYTQTINQPDQKYTSKNYVLKENSIHEIDKENVKKGQKKCILLTDLGIQVLTYLLEHFSMIINVEFTSLVENDLDRIANGEIEWILVVQKVYHSFIDTVHLQNQIKTMKTNSKYPEPIPLGKFNNKEVIIKIGPYGPYIHYNNKNSNLKYLLQKTDKKYTELTLEDIKDILLFPMKLGKYKKNDITINIGPYGKYLKYKNKNYKIPQKNNYTLDESLQWIH